MERMIVLDGVEPTARVCIPLPPPTLAGSNGRKYWPARAEQMRTDSAVALAKVRSMFDLTGKARAPGSLLVPLPTFVRPAVDIKWCSKKEVDFDNAISKLKGYIDGLGLGGLWTDDKVIKRASIELFDWSPELGEGVWFIVTERQGLRASGAPPLPVPPLRSRKRQ